MSFYNHTAAILQCSPRAATLLKFLMEKANNSTHSSFWRISKIMTRCAFSRSTYHRAIRELTKAGLVTVKERAERCGRQMSNEYILNLESLSGQAQTQGTAAPKIKVAGSVRLTGTAYKIYLYLQAKCGRKGYRVSRKDIAAACGITAPTVSRYIRFLQAKGYIHCQSVMRADGGQGYSFYAVTLPAKTKLLRRCIFFALLCDTLPLITDDTPLTLSKFKLINRKDKKDLRYLIAYRKYLMRTKRLFFRQRISHKHKPCKTYLARHASFFPYFSSRTKLKPAKSLLRRYDYYFSTVEYCRNLWNKYLCERKL